MDFDDLLVRTVNLLELFPDVREKYRRIFRWVLVDEYQDTNRAQYRMLAAAGRGTPESDRGRRRLSGGLLVPRRRHPQHPRLRERLPRRRDGPARAELPLDADDPRRGERADRPQREPEAASTCGPTATRRADRRSPSSTTSTPRRATSPSEVNRLVEEGTSRDEIAVFYRMNAQSRVLEDTLVRFEIPYQVIGGTKFYDRAEIKDAVAYLQPARQPRRRGLLRSRRQLAAARDRRPDPGAAALPREHARRGHLGRVREADAASPGSAPPRSRRSSRFADSMAMLREQRRADRVGRRAARSRAARVRLHRGARGRAHGRGRGPGREPRGAGRRRRRVRRQPRPRGRPGRDARWRSSSPRSG